MLIGIGEKIRHRREEKGVSQDAFARYLDVNCKDVIRWEEGKDYPPLELVPVIANYFGVPTDELLCMERFDNEDRIRSYTDAFQEKVASGSIRDAVEIIREGILHFPKDYRLKCLLMYGLYLSCDRPASVKHYSGELLAIGQEILGNCTADAIRVEAKRLLCLHYYEDLNDPEKARELALSLPGRKSCREDMLPIISEGDAKLTSIQENISAYTSLLCAAIVDYTESDVSLSAREKIAFCETARQIRERLYPNGDVFEDAYVHMMLLKDLAVLYMAVDEQEKTLDCLEDCARCAADFDALPKTLPHTSPLVKRLRFSKQQLQIPSKNKKTPLRDIFLNEILPLSCFEPIRYHARITDILAIFRP